MSFTSLPVARIGLGDLRPFSLERVTYRGSLQMLTIPERCDWWGYCVGRDVLASVQGWEVGYIFLNFIDKWFLTPSQPRRPYQGEGGGNTLLKEQGDIDSTSSGVNLCMAASYPQSGCSDELDLPKNAGRRRFPRVWCLLRMKSQDKFPPAIKRSKDEYLYIYLCKVDIFVLGLVSVEVNSLRKAHLSVENLGKKV